MPVLLGEEMDILYWWVCAVCNYLFPHSPFVVAFCTCTDDVNSMIGRKWLEQVALARTVYLLTVCIRNLCNLLVYCYYVSLLHVLLTSPDFFVFLTSFVLIKLFPDCINYNLTLSRHHHAHSIQRHFRQFQLQPFLQPRPQPPSHRLRRSLV